MAGDRSSRFQAAPARRRETTRGAKEYSMPKTVSEIVSEAKSKIDNLTPEQVQQELAGGNAVLIDIREPDELERNGLIPGSVFAPRGMLEWWADPTSEFHRPEFDPSKRAILY